ncbi:MAG: hypothetical protein K6F71_07570 [Ruminococcus sp.]|uniref:hypothetical protein n=1 Tax=Ruminococcus sp. TaxID=41978 RepID=UPI0025DF0B49|nr:hypothetical protein [Ruminococcus sp.]MCR5540660.1 hypothetical protein [Ruminococcus sp.]
MQVRWKDVFKLLSVIPLVIISNLVEIYSFLINKPISQDNTFDNIFFGMIFEDSYRKEDSTLSYTLFALAIPIVFNILYGGYLYKDLHLKNIYKFVREKSRFNWYIKNLLKLLSIAVVYCSIWLMFVYAISIVNTGEGINAYTLKNLFICYLTVTEYTFVTTLMVNIFSFFFGTAISFILVYFIISILYYITVHFEKISLFGTEIDSAKINIIDNTMLTWQDKIDFSCVIVNMIYMMICIAIIGIIISKIDIGLKDKESL